MFFAHFSLSGMDRCPDRQSEMRKRKTETRKSDTGQKTSRLKTLSSNFIFFDDYGLIFQSEHGTILILSSLRKFIFRKAILFKQLEYYLVDLT
jgi:hypothetical protein